MARWKSRGAKSQRREKQKREEHRKSEKKEDAGARSSKVAKHGGSGGSKSWLAEAAGAEPCGQMREEKLHALPSQKVQNTPRSEHF
jgi:hypothetical protein